MAPEQPTSPPDGTAPLAAGLPAWRRLTRSDGAAVLLLALVVILFAAPHLPPGVCLGDAGDLQLAGAVLGIPHSPGYPAYVSLAYLATWLPGDAAYLVSVTCMAVGTGVVVLCALIAIQLGAQRGAACAIALMLIGHPRFWQNLITPEVYIFSIAFLAASVYSLTHYARTGRKHSLGAAAFLFTVAMINRPPVLLAAPFFLLGWWLSRRRWESGPKPALRSLALLAACAALPTVYGLSFLYVRDVPQTRYNYIEHHNRETPELPGNQAGPLAKLQRVVWMATAREFHYRAGNSWGQMRAKWRWLCGELELPTRIQPLEFVPVLRLTGLVLIVALGLRFALRGCPAAAMALCGIAVQGTAFILAYKDYGQAADLLPLLIPLAVFAAAAVGSVLAGRTPLAQNAMALAFVALVAAYTLLQERREYGRHADATEYLQQVDLATFPENAVIFSHWTFAPPLLYERELRARRPDVEVVIAQPVNWLRMSQQFGERPIFLARMLGPGHGRQITPFRNVWRLGPPTARTP